MNHHLLLGSKRATLNHLRNNKAREPVDDCFVFQGSAVLFLKLWFSLILSSRNLQTMKLQNLPHIST